MYCVIADEGEITHQVTSSWTDPQDAWAEWVQFWENRNKYKNPRTVRKNHLIKKPNCSTVLAHLGVMA